MALPSDYNKYFKEVNNYPITLLLLKSRHDLLLLECNDEDIQASLEVSTY